MPLTLAKNGIERSLADWGIDTETPSLTLRGFSADEFGFSMAVADAFAPRTFVYGDDIVLRKDGVVLFRGKLRRRPVFGGPQERQRYIAYNYWYELEQLIYEQRRSVIGLDFISLNLVATTQVVFGRDTSNGAKVSTQQEMANLAYFGSTNGVAMSFDLAFTGLVAPFEQSNDVTVASGLRRMAAWQPDLLARTEYAYDPPALRIRRPLSADVKIVDLTAAALLLAVECERRDDMAPRGVVFNFLTSVTDPATGLSYTRVTTQQGGPAATGPRVIKATLPIGDGETIPPNLAANYYASLSTVFLEGRLTLKGEEIDTTLRSGDILSFTHGSAEWAGSLAPVTEVVHQLGQGVTTVSFGPPTFLPASSFAALNQRLKDAQPPKPAPPDDPGDPTGPAPGNADTGRGPAGGGVGGSASATGVPITHCVGGTQVTDYVRKA